MNKKIGIKTVIALMLAASALTCIVLFGLIGRQLGFSTDLYTEVRTYIALRREIEESYIGTYDSKNVSEAALRATVVTLEDRWSYYLSPELYVEYTNTSNNQYFGLGISVETDETTGGIHVVDVYIGSAAESAGLVAGDVIIAIDGIDITQMALGDAIALVDRELGQSVSMTVVSTDGQTQELEAIFSTIARHPVQYELLDGAIGLIQIDNFEAGSAKEFNAAIDALFADGAKSFVFDVRNNGGGRVTELKKMLDRLLPECEIFVAVEKSGTEYISRSDEAHIDIPAVVLVNAYSFSAAEYFAAVLQEYDYATVVGEQTTGKNRSQITIKLPDGGALHISSGEYLTPERVNLTEQGGITPDEVVAIPDEDTALLYAGQLEDAKDAQLQKARALLQ